MTKKARIMLILLSAVLTGTLARLFYIMRTQPADAAAAQSVWTVTVAESRGTIYDTQLRPLVNETKEYRAALAPDAALLAEVRDSTDDESYARLRTQLESGAPAAVRLQKPIALRTGLRLYYVPVRYGKRLLAPHLIGYTDSGLNGVTGVEKAFDTLLRQYGGAAAAAFTINGRGGCMTGVEPVSEDTTGRSVGGVILTIDRDIQTIVEDTGAACLPKGAIVVLDPYSGAIRAMASFPSFQPSTVADSIAADDGALVNRALSLYDCGSVFKIVTAAAALEAGVPASCSFDCAGRLAVEDTVFHCHNRLGHQQQTMIQAMANSCNLYFIQLAAQIGPKALYSMANNLGFGRAITLAESLGAPTAILPSLAALEASPAATANLSFGQGYLMASPLHMAQLVATVVNDGVMPPVHLVQGFVDENGQAAEQAAGAGYTVLTPDTARQLRKMLEAVLTSGTGKAAASPLFSAAGKTGTAETGQTGQEKSVVQGWFAGYFPAEAPRYVIVVLAEDANNTGGNASAAFRQIAEALYRFGTDSAGGS